MEPGVEIASYDWK